MEKTILLSELDTKNRRYPLLDELMQRTEEGLVFTMSRPVALREVKDIFHFRARHNEKIGEPIKGFPELIAGLDAFSSDMVVLYSVVFEEDSYKIFADADGKEIAGILKFPKKPALAKFSRVCLQTEKYNSLGACLFDVGYIIEVYPDSGYKVEFADANGIRTAQIVAREEELQLAESVYETSAKRNL